MSIMLVKSTNAKNAIDKMNVISHLIATAWSSAHGAKNTEMLHSVRNALREYMEHYGYIDDLSTGELNPDKKMVYKWLRKINKRFAEWGMIANSELNFTIRSLNNDPLEGFKDSVDTVRAGKFDTSKARKTLLKWSKNGGFSLVYKIISYDDYKTLQGLYSDVLHYARYSLDTKLSQVDLRIEYDIKCHFAFSDFLTNLQNCLLASDKITQFDAIHLTTPTDKQDFYEIPTSFIELKKVRRKLQQVRPNQTELIEMLNEHIEQRQNQKSHLRNVAPVRHIKPPAPIETKSDFLVKDMKTEKTKLKSTFERKITKKWSGRLVTVHCEPEFIEKIEKYAQEKKKENTGRITFNREIKRPNVIATPSEEIRWSKEHVEFLIACDFAKDKDCRN